jgi:hypothetical protein
LGTSTTFADALVSAITNPLLWIFLAVSLVLGGFGKKWPWALGLAIAAMIIDSAISTYSRASAGLQFSPVAGLVSFVTVWLVYLAAALLRRGIRRGSP